MLTQVKFAFLCENIALNAPHNPHTSRLTPQVYQTPHTSYLSHTSRLNPHTSRLTQHTSPLTAHITYYTFRRGIHEVQNQYQHNHRQTKGSAISGCIRYKFNELQSVYNVIDHNVCIIVIFRYWIRAARRCIANECEKRIRWLPVRQK